VDVAEAREKLEEYQGVTRGDYERGAEGAEEYKEARSDAWGESWTRWSNLSSVAPGAWALCRVSLKGCGCASPLKLLHGLNGLTPWVTLSFSSKARTPLAISILEPQAGCCLPQL
jgi:hypothetical protein